MLFKVCCICLLSVWFWLACCSVYGAGHLETRLHQHSECSVCWQTYWGRRWRLSSLRSAGHGEMLWFILHPDCFWSAHVGTSGGLFKIETCFLNTSHPGSSFELQGGPSVKKGLLVTLLYYFRSAKCMFYASAHFRKLSQIQFCLMLQNYINYNLLKSMFFYICLGQGLKQFKELKFYKYGMTKGRY